MIDQLGIAIFGVLAIALSQCERVQLRRWACIAGMCAQPFWFHTTAAHGQWGIFALCFLYAAAWLKGVHTYWWRPSR